MINALEPRLLLSAVLAADINSQPSRAWSPTGLTRVGDVTYLSQHDGVHGPELWKTDGTDAGTVMIKDIFPGLGSAKPSGFVATDNGTVYFVATDGATGYELWKTDGTKAGTVLVKDIQPGYENSNPSTLTAVGNQIYFFADDGVHGNELWVSDGTDSGTRLVLDLFPGAPGQTSHGIGFANGSLFFDGTNGTATGLWQSTATGGNAIVILSQVLVSQIVSFDNHAYVADQRGPVWTTDGTRAGTKEIGVYDTPVQQFVITPDALYYSRSTGSYPGVIQIPKGASYIVQLGTFSGPNSLANVNGDLYFTDSATGSPIYRVYKENHFATKVADTAPGGLPGGGKRGRRRGGGLLYGVHVVRGVFALADSRSDVSAGAGVATQFCAPVAAPVVVHVGGLAGRICERRPVRGA